MTAISSLRKGLSLLDLFTDEEQEITISELARRADLPKTTTHRLVHDLTDWGALEFGERGVRLGFRLFELGNHVPRLRQLCDAAAPITQRLHMMTHLTTNLAIRDGDQIVYLQRLTRETRRFSPGMRGAMHATALGKAILAHSTPTVLAKVLEQPLTELAPGTIRDENVLRAELADIRKLRLAYDYEESKPGLYCVAAPVFGKNGQIIGAVSVGDAPDVDSARRFAGTVRAAARTISNRLGPGDVPRDLAS